MTPDKRLDQIEPVLADVAQKTDRLIESNGKIFEVATRANENAEIAARGLAGLTIEMRQNFIEVRAEIQQQFGQLDAKIDSKVDQLDAKIDSKVDSLRQEMNQRFGQVEQTQQEILTILRERLL